MQMSERMNTINKCLLISIDPSSSGILYFTGGGFSELKCWKKYHSLDRIQLIASVDQEHDADHIRIMDISAFPLAGANLLHSIVVGKTDIACKLLREYQLGRSDGRVQVLGFTEQDEPKFQLLASMSLPVAVLSVACVHHGGKENHQCITR
jgi:hypothetical protein